MTNSNIENKVVAKVGKIDLTISTLKEYFNSVQNTENWKLGVKNKEVFFSTLEQRIIDEAVIFYTGSIPSWKFSNGKTFISFAGYYEAIGA